MCILAVLLQKLCMRALLDDMSITYNENFISKGGVRQPMRNCNRTLALAQMIKMFKNAIFGYGIKCGGRFIKYHIFAILEIRSCKPDKLPLTAGQVLTVVGIVPSENAVKAVLPIPDNFTCAADIASFIKAISNGF